MIDVTTASPDEIIEEARRRDERRRKSLPLHEDATEAEKRAAQFTDADDRVEKEIQRDVWKLYRAFGCDCFWMSQARKTRQTPGVPDLIVFHQRGRAMWFHECKNATGVQSPAQKYFEAMCEGAGLDLVLGGVAAAENQLVKAGIAERVDGSLEPKR